MKKLKRIILGLIFLLQFNSCNKLESSSFYCCITYIEDIYPQDLVNALLNLGFKLNEGDNPPIINVVKLIIPMKLEASTVPSD